MRWSKYDRYRAEHETAVSEDVSSDPEEDSSGDTPDPSL
jgi:hypothetical protein